MLQRFITWIKGVLRKMFNINTTGAKRALGAEIAVSISMQTALALWMDMFTGDPPWLNAETQSLGLPAAIVSEFARLVMVELDCEVTGSQRGDWLNAELQRAVLPQLRNAVELACAGGGVVFKPYPDGKRLAVDCVPAWRFFPTSFNSLREVTGAVFVERVQKGETYYTRMEQHTLTDSGYIIRNLAYRSFTKDSLGSACALDAVDEWSTLEPELEIRYKDGTVPERMLFSYLRTPFSNTIDLDSPLGVAVFARSVELIREADVQYSRILWEFEGSELAVDASVGALQRTGSDGKPAKLPQRQKRLFRELSIDGGQGDLYKVFSPEIRDTSLFNGLDKLLKRIEFNCSLAYGTLSDPRETVEKTAEEIRASKQRSYAAVCDLQAALRVSLNQLVWAMDFYASLYSLAPRGEFELSCTFGDGILEDTDKEFARRLQLVSNGYLKPEKLLAWYYGVSEEEAAEMMPAAEEPLGFET